MNQGPPFNHRYYQYAHKIRVDREGNGDTSNIDDAILIADVLTRDVFNPVLIQLGQPGVYVVGKTLTLPTFTDIAVESWKSQNQNTPGVVILRGLVGTIPASETEFIKCMGFNNITGVTIINQMALPANFLADYALVRAVDGISLMNCTVGISPYTGANTVHAFHHENFGGVTSSVITDCILSSFGSSSITVRSARALGLYDSQTFGAPDVSVQLDHTAANQRTTIMNCRLIDRSGLQAISFDLKTASASTFVRVINTRIPLNRRTVGNYDEIHATPQQLQTNLRAASRTTGISSTIDAYMDGSIEVTVAGTTQTMPPLTDAIVGQAFKVKHIETLVGTTTIDGDGVELIEGAASVTLTAPGQVYIIEKNARGSWSLM